jgi:hypothetical protein
VVTQTVTPLLGDFGLIASMQGPWWDRAFARIIDWDTESSVHHAVGYVGDGPDGDIIEAVRRVSYGHADTYDDIVWSTGRLPAHLTPNDGQRRLIVQALKDMLGDKYNSIDIVAIGVAQPRIDDDRLAQWSAKPPWYVRRLDSDGREICSQAIAKAYAAAGISLIPGRPACLVSPGDLGSLLLPA